MNERINQLAEQCRIETYGVNGELLEFGFDEQKFAELIVKECADFLKDTLDDHFAAEQLVEHFGVEE
jgi:hypothetical protein